MLGGRDEEHAETALEEQECQTAERLWAQVKGWLPPPKSDGKPVVASNRGIRSFWLLDGEQTAG